MASQEEMCPSKMSETHEELEDDVEGASELGWCHLCEVDRPNHSSCTHSDAQHHSSHKQELHHYSEFATSKLDR